MSNDYQLPENTETTLYVLMNYFHSYTMNELLIIAQNKWGEDIDFDKLKIGSEYKQIANFGYRGYDPMDYTTFITLEYEG
jgi:hypothetical protein